MFVLRLYITGSTDGKHDNSYGIHCLLCMSDTQYWLCGNIGGDLNLANFSKIAKLNACHLYYMQAYICYCSVELHCLSKVSNI